MISFENALAIAKEHKPNFDSCAEYDGGWVFSYSGDAEYDGGYGHSPVVVTKSGKVLSMPQFILSGKAGKLIRQNVDLTEIKETSKWVLGGDGITDTIIPEENLERIKEINRELEQADNQNN